MSTWLTLPAIALPVLVLVQLLEPLVLFAVSVASVVVGETANAGLGEPVVTTGAGVVPDPPVVVLELVELDAELPEVVELLEEEAAELELVDDSIDLLAKFPEPQPVKQTAPMASATQASLDIGPPAEC